MIPRGLPRGGSFAEIIELCRRRQVPVLVDGAHAPGQVPIEISRWQPDFYTGNFHKWLFAPRPAAFLYIGPRWREKVRPPILSNYYGKGIQSEFAWCGTFDPTPLYCTEAGLDFFKRLGGNELSKRNHALASFGGRLLSEVFQREGFYSPDSDLFGAMYSCPVTENVGSVSNNQIEGLRERFLKESGIEVHFAAFNEQLWIRLSAQAFNCTSDMERLAQTLREGKLTTALRGD